MARQAHRVIDSFTLADAEVQSPVIEQPFHRWVNQNGDVWLTFHRREKGFLLRFPGLADFFLTSEGTHARCTPVPGTDSPTLEHLWINQVQPLIRSMSDDLVLHGGCVEVGAEAIAFLGPSGRGKSTLTGSFALAGNRFLGDDLLVLSMSASLPVARPSHPSIRIWQDSREELMSLGATPAPRVSYSDKDRFPAAADLPYCDEERTLATAFFIDEEPTERPVLRQLRGVEKVSRWVENIFLLDIDNPDRLQGALDRATRIATKVPSVALSYPRAYSALPEVRGAILDYLDNPEDPR